MSDVVAVKQGYDVDLGSFADDLRTLALELDHTMVYVEKIETTREVSAEDSESATLSITVTPTEESFLSGGYSIPFDDG